MKSSEFIKNLKENASGGATGSASVATVSTGLGGATTDLIKRQKSYSNQQTPGGTVKVKKVK
jgi:hypothetical protein